MPAGRPKILDETRKALICDMLAMGCSLKTAAALIGCCVRTILNTCDTDLDFLYRLEHAQAQATLFALKSVRKGAKKSWRAAAWLLQSIEPEHYGRPGDMANQDERSPQEHEDRFAKYGVPRPVEDYEIMPIELSPLVAKSSRDMTVSSTADSTPADEVNRSPQG